MANWFLKRLILPLFAGKHGFSLGMMYHSDIYPGVFYLKGEMRELRIGNYARSQMGIDSAPNSKLTGKEPGLVGYWDLDQNGTHTTAIDRTGNGNKGHLIGGVQFVHVSSLGQRLTGINRLQRYWF